MANTVRLVTPSAAALAKEYRRAARITSLEGRRIALMDNMKPNGDVLLERIAANLRETHQDLECKRFRKPNTSGEPFQAAVLDTVAGRFSAAIGAIGD